jgi:hypothetical protein
MAALVDRPDLQTPKMAELLPETLRKQLGFGLALKFQLNRAC